MPSSLRILADVNNAVASSTVTASSILPAKNSAFRQQTARAGNGSVRIDGGYTGADDTLIEIEIVAPATGNERASQPVFSGAGNGTMTTPTIAPGAAAQDWTVTLVDLGTETTHAQLILYADVLLQAKVSGAAGNALTLDIAPNLTVSAAVGALSVEIAQGGQEWADQKMNFGAVPLNPDGTLADNCPRLIFGGDLSRVYRHYKRWDGDQWQYGVSPKLAAGYAAGAQVQAVTGDYSATVTDGVTTETYSGTALYDLLLAFGSSTLFSVASVIAKDLKPGGMAAIDVPIRTSAFALPVEKNRDDLPDLEGLIIGDGLTETLSVTCTANTPVGGETWAVRSCTADALPAARTGEPYVSGPAHFTIPVIPLDGSPISGEISITDQSFPRNDDSGIPAICLYRPELGAKASSKTLRLVWTKRPPLDCDCHDAAVSGRPSKACLGLNIEGEDDMSIPAGYQSRLESLYSWRSGFVAANTQLKSATGELLTVYNDVDLANQVAKIFSDGLADLYQDSDTPASAALTQWDADLTAVDSSLAQLEAMSTGSASARWQVGTQFNAGDTLFPPVQRENQHHYQIFIHPVDYTNPENGFAGTYPGETFTALEDIASWPVDGGSVTVSGKMTFTSGFGERIVDGTATLIDLGPIDSADAVTSADPAVLRRSVDQFVERYRAAMDLVRAKAGIVPKSDASGSGSCWRDVGDSYYWVIQGTNYLPVFNNVYYTSASLQDDGSGNLVPMSTFEFGFGLRVACADRLREGDTITIDILGVSANYPFSIGDRYDIPIVAGGALDFTGGIDGTDTLTWTVAGSLNGAQDPYALGLAESGYSAGDLAFVIHRGGIPFALGDAFTFAVTAGEQFRWRRDGGTWSADTALEETVMLVDGLSAVFTAGPAPSYVLGDLYRFEAIQPNAPSHVQSAGVGSWRWSGSDATLTLSWETDQEIRAVGVLQHALTDASTCSMTLKDAAGATLTVVSLSTGAGPRLAFLDAPLLVRSIVVTVSEAGGMALGWAYAGIPLATSHQPASCRIDRSYALARSGAINPHGVYLGAGRGGEIVWTDWLLQSDLDALIALIDAAKSAGDVPICVVPNALHSAEATLCRIDSDNIQISDLFEFQPRDEGRRRLSMILPLAAVMY